MSKRSDQDLLLDIQEAIQRVRKYCATMNYQRFSTDLKTQDAVLRNLEIMGEAVKHVSKKFKAAHPEIPWTEMAKLRDKLIHHYFGVNIDIVWDIVDSYLPDVAQKLKSIIKSK